MNKGEALQETLEQLCQHFGIDTVRSMDELPLTEADSISTGIPGLDIALENGGIRGGQIVEIYGPRESGKTLLALQISRQYQQQKLPVLYIDADKRLTKEIVKYAGVGSDDFYVMNLGTLARTLEACMMASLSFGIIVIDSLASLASKEKMRGSDGDSCAELFTETLADMFQELSSVLEENKCTLITISQVKGRNGVIFEKPERAIGGKVLGRYASVKLCMSKSQEIWAGRNVIGHRARIKFVRDSKWIVPVKDAEVDFLLDNGICVEGDLLNQGVETMIIRKWFFSYYYEKQKMGAGRKMTCKFLRENPTVRQQIVDRLMGM